MGHLTGNLFVLKGKNVLECFLFWGWRGPDRARAAQPCSMESRSKRTVVK